MIIEGERDILASPERIWEIALRPEILSACIPGCEQLEQTDPEHYNATMLSKVGPIRARFSGTVTLEEINLPISCRLSGDGSGGIAGFAKGSALISVAATEGGSHLTYSAQVDIGGKIAGLGDRLFRGVVERNINSFFDNLQAQVTAKAA